MKKLFYFIIALAGLSSSAQVGIGLPTENIAASAQFEVASTTKGFLTPRMTEAQKNAIASPAAGLLVYQTDGTNGFYYFDGSIWKSGLGPQGIQGLKGDTGSTGAQGIQGIQGLKGDIGATGAAGSNASVSIGAIAGNSTANGGTITSGVLRMAPADGINGGIVTNGTQTFAGSKIFSKDITIKDLTVGHGGFNEISDVAFGNNALISNQSGTYNVAIGQNAAHNNNSGSNNVVIGSAANYYNESSSEIVAVGNGALHAERGAGNVAIGAWAGHRGNISDNLTNSVFLGRYASAGGGAIDNSVALGNGASVDASNTIQLGNGGITDVKTSGKVTASGFKTANGTSSQFLMADGTVSSGSSSATHTVGEIYGGGIVFYVTTDGLHGLISETQLISPNTNSTSNTDIYNYSQAQNMISNPNNHSTNGKLFTDWRLPTSYEFSVLYAMKSYFSSSYQGRLNFYNWTSTPAASPNETTKMVIYYLGVAYESGFNGGPCGVIAVRSF